MKIWVVSLFGDVDSVWSTEKRAKARCLALDREVGGGAFYQDYTVNVAGDGSEPPN